MLSAVGRKIAKEHRARQTPHGRQSVKKLMAHGAATSSIEMTGAPRQFDRAARKWNVDYAFYKTGPDKYLLFFKSGQADAMTACFSEYSRTVLVLTALGKDPRNIGGYDLLIPLADFDKVCVQGLNGPIWALIALNSGAYELPANPEAATPATAEMYLQKILTSQNEDGSFALDAGAEGDVDITAMALQALAFYDEREDVSPVIEKALNYLSAVQDDDGGYSTWDEPNAESCAQALTALASLGISVEDERFVKNGCSVSDALLTYALGDGTFMHSKAQNTSDPLGTEQAFYALIAQERAEKGLSSLYDMSK